MSRVKRKKRRRTGFSIIAIMVLFICGIVVYKRRDLEQEFNSKTLKKEALNKQIEVEVEIEKDLEDKKAYMQTKKFVEDVARDTLGLVYEDEVLFKESE